MKRLHPDSVAYTLLLGASFFVWLGGCLFDGTSTTLGYGIALGGAGSFVAYWVFARRHVPAVH